MEELEVGKPEEILRRIDFQKIVPSEDLAKRMGSKIYILTHGVMKDEFRLKHIEGDFDVETDFENVEQKKQEIRDKLGIYSETELQNLKRRFEAVGYIEQKEDSAAYKLTEEGRYLFHTYLQMVSIYRISKMIEYAQINNNLEALEGIGDTKEHVSDLSEEMNAELRENFRKEGVRPEDQVADETRAGLTDNRLGTNFMYDKLTLTVQELHSRIQKLTQERFASIMEEGQDEAEEILEIMDLIDGLAEKPHTPNFETPEPPEDMYEQLNK
ncbi:MAG: hypothetical protein ABEJ95_07650 [Candidatus Nanohalobium sp.]